MESVSGGPVRSVDTEDGVQVGGVCSRWDQAHKGQVGTLQATGLLFRPLAHGVRLHFVSCIDLPPGSRTLREVEVIVWCWSLSLLWVTCGVIS